MPALESLVNPEDPQWWEKSVEYLFIARAITESWMSIVSPLAGLQEKALGDAILKNNESKFFLIEFKRTSKSWTDEYKKYGEKDNMKECEENYGKARNALSVQSAADAHLLIYAALPADFSGRLSNVDLVLVRTPYWKPEDQSLLEGFSTGGATPSELRPYMKDLATWRGLNQLSDGEGDGRGGGGGGFLVVAITDEGTIGLTLPMFERLDSLANKRTYSAKP